MAYTLPSGRSRIVQNHAPTLGRLCDIFVARLATGIRTKPTQQTFTVASGGAAKGATTITVTETISSALVAGQYLQFATSTGLEFLAMLTADIDSGSALTVAPLPEAIPAAAVANFPSYLWDRTGADVERSYNRATFATFNTGGDEDGIVTGAARSISLPGIKYFKNDGYLTALRAANDGAEIWLALQEPAPSPAYTVGAVIEGPASVTAAPQTAAVDGFIQADLTISFNGKPLETPPTPTA